MSSGDSSRLCSQVDVLVNCAGILLPENNIVLNVNDGESRGSPTCRRWLQSAWLRCRPEEMSGIRD